MGAATRGGDLLAHGLSLFMQNFRRAFMISVLISLAVLAAGVGRPTEENRMIWEIYSAYTKGNMGIAVNSLLPGSDSRRLDFAYGWDNWRQEGDARVILPKLEKEWLPPANRAVRPYLWATAGAWFLSFCGVWVVFWRQGKKAVADKILDGQTEVKNKALELVLKEFRVQPPHNIFQKLGVQKCEVDDRPGIVFGNFEIPPSLICRNQLVAGGVGTGKTTAICQELDSLRHLKIKTVIYDAQSQFCQKYYRKGKDFILNPADVECVAWDVFSDITDRAQLVSLIKMLIPPDPDKGVDFFVKGARKLLADLMLYARAKDLHISEVYRIAVDSTLDELYAILCSLKRSESKGLMDPAAAEQAQGIRGTLTSSESVQFLDLFPHSKNPFSIRKWMQSNDDSWLFITSCGSASAIHSIILPYISTTLDISLQSVVGVESYSLRRAVIADELNSAGYLPALEAHVSELRKWGVSILVGFQDINQMLGTYGEEATQSIITNCQSRLVLRLDNQKTADAMGPMLGLQEVEETSTGASWGADDMRDGESINKTKTQKAAIPSHKIMHLPDLQGYLKIAGPFPVTKVQLKLQKRKTIHPGFVQHPGVAWDVEGQVEHFQELEKVKVQRGQDKAKNDEAKKQAEEEEF